MKEKMQVSYLHKTIERLLIFLVISSFVFCLLSFLKDIASFNNKDILAIYSFAALLFTQILSFLIITIYFDEKSKFSSFIRFFFIYMLVIGIICFFTARWISFPFVFLGTAIQTILYYKIYAPFFEHDCFEEQCTAKNNTSLQKELYDYNMHLSQSAIGYKQNRTLFVILALILTVLSGLCFASKITISIFTMSLFLAYFVFAGCHFFLYAFYVKEASYASNGFSNVFDFRLKTLSTSFIIFLLCFAAGLLVSSNHSPLKLYYLLYFFRLFKGKASSEALPQVPETSEAIIERRMQEIKSFQTALSDTETKGNDIFAICCALFFIIGIAWFFLKPFLSKKFYNLLKDTDLKGMLKKFFHNVKGFFKNIFRPRVKRPLFDSQNSRSFMQDMEDFLHKSKKSKEKKAELDRLSKVFVKLIDWGEEHNIPYSKNLAPAEYTVLFKNKNADIAGSLFEQALYAKEPLTKEEEEGFNKAVEEVCKGGGPEPV